MEGLKEIINSVVFWSAWIIIPLIMEIIPSIGSAVILARKNHRERRHPRKDPRVWPQISVIIPVYNSEETLEQCVDSVAAGTYPKDRIRIFLVNNQGKDHSFDVYKKCQDKYPELRMQWMNAEQGKSRALNLALYNSGGKYIINIDSDGVLDKKALANMVREFEKYPEKNVMTGTVLTRCGKIKEYKGFFRRLLRNCEFMEYAQAFLAGRSYLSETNSVYTISGAFSAFRKSVLLKSQLYNTMTISEDTQLTFQMRYLQDEKIGVCTSAIFYVDPVESLGKLYVQRQRWQRGALEVSRLFMKKTYKLRKFFTDPNIHNLVYDHTFAFPRLIWYLALVLLTWLSYSGSMVLWAFAIIFALYAVVGYVYYFSIRGSMEADWQVRKYYRQHWWVVALLPIYNSMVFFMRFAGIINSIGTDSKWRTRDFSDEGRDFAAVVKDDAEKTKGIYRKIYGFFNVRPEQEK